MLLESASACSDESMTLAECKARSYELCPLSFQRGSNAHSNLAVDQQATEIIYNAVTQLEGASATGVGMKTSQALGSRPRQQASASAPARAATSPNY